ncbi:peptide chain release factor N(5)-glutamine methyltransferase [Companilactobacillus ginsenosidimutans]|uniref:Release factor glutamine methyltransferase n=1 Tax=Companilactobacillus ginsenosidimutans TaxID=1007676 RepID=A0A0H4QEK7_9LACO|nr:peptide chain release factor N(5)-glutamine methyltransferase [Companilactobacillus ginsenosidimutans]AKP66372.1 SAM-dependent methyltransferase [Companilactobacillus ginsenosidimutans]
MERLSYSNALDRAFLLLKEKNKFPEDAEYLMEELSGFNYTQLQLHRNDPVPGRVLHRFRDGLIRLSNDEPVQYILGHAYFMGRDFTVNSDVLIPRQETEEMVQKIIDDHPNMQEAILDVGTGSGAIAVSLGINFSKDEILASDISEGALKVAQLNADNYQTNNVYFQQSDIFDDIKPQRFNIIVSNPPYIAYSEKDVMDESVKKFEPDLALYGKNDGLDFYERISKSAANYLYEDGILYMEFGYRQKNEVQQIFNKNMPEYAVEFYKDISGNYRYLKAFRKKV